jgi:DUF3078 family protein
LIVDRLPAGRLGVGEIPIIEARIPKSSTDPAGAGFPFALPWCLFCINICMKRILASTLVVINLTAFAQDQTVRDLQNNASKTIKKDPDTTARRWRSGGFFNLNLAQGSLSNWAAGGDKFSLSLNSLLSVYAFYKKDKSSWDNTLDVNFGYLRSTSLGSRKNDDRFDLLSKYGYAIAPKWNVAALFNFRTQLANGYTYGSNNDRTFSSAFLSPAYVLLSLGFDFKPTANFSLFLSPVTARWTIVKNDTLSAHGLYGVEPGKHVRSEFGAFVSANYIKEFNKNVSYKGRLDLFSNYRHNPEKVDVYMSNILSLKLSKVLAATWNVDLIYDDDVRLFGDDGKSAAWQIKSLVGIGLMVKF